jgi:hypothetical protein
VHRRSLRDSDAAHFLIPTRRIVILMGNIIRPSSARPALAPEWTSGRVISVWKLDEPLRARLGVDVNGIWQYLTPEEVARTHARGGLAVHSVEVVALKAYDLRAKPELRQAVSADVFGNESTCDWYTWEDVPLAMTINSPVLQRHIVDEAIKAMDMGADAVFLDEHQSAAMILSLEKGGAGFSADDQAAYVDDLRRKGFGSFCAYLQRTFGISRPDTITPAEFLRETTPELAATRDKVFAEYKTFQDAICYRLMADVCARIHEEARRRGRQFAVGGNFVGMGRISGGTSLFSMNWDACFDFMVSELDVDFFSAQKHDGAERADRKNARLPQRSAFAPLYRLGQAVVPGPTVLMPGGRLMRALATRNDGGAALSTLYAEALAFGGVWGLGYWSGAYGFHGQPLAPEALAPLTTFVAQHRAVYEGPREPNEVAVIYNNQGILADPRRHRSFTGLCAALTALNVQFDVLMAGDDRFAPVPLHAGRLRQYQCVLLPVPNAWTDQNLETLRGLAGAGANVIVFGDADPGLMQQTGAQAAPDIGAAYGAGERDSAQAALQMLLQGLDQTVRSVSAPDTTVTVARRRATTDVVHVVNYGAAQKGVTIEIRRSPSAVPTKSVQWLRPGHPDAELPSESVDHALRCTLPELEVYAVLLME